MLLGAALYSCEDPGVKPDPNRLVDVVIGVSEQGYTGGESMTRLWVAPAGYVSWSPGDDVTIIDQGEGNYGQKFLYTPQVVLSQGGFAGRLLAGMGTKTYYAYRQAPEADNFQRVGHVITLGRHDMVVDQGTQDIRQLYGNHNTMVSAPVEFDAESPGAKYVEFHNVNCLIEAIISPAENGELSRVMFDAIEFVLEAADNNPDDDFVYDTPPFSTEVTVDLTQIVDPTPNDENDDVVIPFTDNDATKVSQMRTRIGYGTARRISDFQGLGSNGRFAVAIVALPTDTPFQSVATVNFWNGNALVGRLQQESRPDRVAQGLRVSALNPINFTDEHFEAFQQPEVDSGNNGNGNENGNGNGNEGDQGENEDEGDQGEDNNDQ